MNTLSVREPSLIESSYVESRLACTYIGRLCSSLNSTDSCSVTEKCKEQFYTKQMNLPSQRLSDSGSISLDQAGSLLSPHPLFIILVAQGLSPHDCGLNTKSWMRGHWIWNTGEWKITVKKPRYFPSNSISNKSYMDLPKIELGNEHHKNDSLVSILTVLRTDLSSFRILSHRPCRHSGSFYTVPHTLIFLTAVP